MTVTVLVVEDEVKLRDLVRRYLEREHWTVVTTGSGAEALSILERGGIDLLVLDLNLPDVTGETIAAEFSGRVPIVMLTAKSAVADRIHGLELGADDYLTKPFSPRELVLRVHAVLRRTAASNVESAITSFGGGALVIDEDRHEATLEGGVVEFDADGMVAADRAGIITWPRLLPQRVDQPDPRVRVRRLRTDGRLTHQEPAAEDRARRSLPDGRRDGPRRRVSARAQPGSQLIMPRRPLLGPLGVRLASAFLLVAMAAVAVFATLMMDFDAISRGVRPHRPATCRRSGRRRRCRR